MSWRSVVVVALFIVGGLTALALHEKEAALLLIGAACGMGIVEKHTPKSTSTKDLQKLE